MRAGHGTTTDLCFKRSESTFSTAFNYYIRTKLSTSGKPQSLFLDSISSVQFNISQVQFHIFCIPQCVNSWTIPTPTAEIVTNTTILLLTGMGLSATLVKVHCMEFSIMSPNISIRTPIHISRASMCVWGSTLEMQSPKLSIKDTFRTNYTSTRFTRDSNRKSDILYVSHYTCLKWPSTTVGIVWQVLC